MKLENKKELASKTLGVGKGRIVFNTQRLNEIKEAITKQDIRDLFNDGAILIREIKGGKKVERRKLRRRAGSIRKVVNQRKINYMVMTRKLRSYVKELLGHEKLSKDQFLMLRKEIKTSVFKSKADIKDRIKELKELKKWDL